MTDADRSRWGLFPWFAEHGTEELHPDDADALRQLSPYGKLFELAEETEGWLVIAYGDRRFRVRPRLFREVPPPARRIGDTVDILSKGERIAATVREIQWHHERSEPFFLLARREKGLSKRYWQSDFL